MDEEYLPLNAMLSPDASYVAPYREPVVVTKPKAELRAIPANKRPISWQVQTALDNYNKMHNNMKDAWDEYVISPEDVQDARDYYNNELLYSDVPGAVPLAALGSTLSGEAYDIYRDIATDPLTVAGSNALRSGKKVTESMGAIIKPLKKSEGDVVRVFHGSDVSGKRIFDDPLTRMKPTKGTSYGEGLYTAANPSKARWFARDFNKAPTEPRSGSIYGFDIPVDEFRENIYRPWIASDKIPEGVIRKEMLSKLTPRRQQLHELSKELGGTDLTIADDEFLLHGVMPYSNVDGREIARYLRDYENVIGSGPYLEVQSPEYLLYKNMEPSYEIIMEPSDYWQYDKFGDLGALYDRKGNRAFDEMINSQMSPYKNATTIK